MTKFETGEACNFDWWSTYKAPAAESANAEWYELIPGDKGHVVSIYPLDEYGFSMTVKFERVKQPVKIRSSMLKKAA